MSVSVSVSVHVSLSSVSVYVSVYVSVSVSVYVSVYVDVSVVVTEPRALKGVTLIRVAVSRFGFWFQFFPFAFQVRVSGLRG